MTRTWLLVVVLLAGCMGPPKTGPGAGGEVPSAVVFSDIDGEQLREGVAEITTPAGSWAAIELRLGLAHWGEQAPFDGNAQVQVDYEIIGDSAQAVVMLASQDSGRPILDSFVAPLPLRGQSSYLFATTSGSTPPEAPPEHPMILVFGAPNAAVTLRIGLGGLDRPAFPSTPDVSALRAEGGLGVAHWDGTSWAIEEYGSIDLVGTSGDLPGGRIVQANAEAILSSGTAVVGFGATGSMEARHWQYDIQVGDHDIQEESSGVPLIPPPIQWDFPYGSPGIRVQSDNATSIRFHAGEEAVVSGETDSFALAMWGHVDAPLADLFGWPPFDGVIRSPPIIGPPMATA